MTDISPSEAYGRWLAEAPREWPDEAWESATRAFIDTIGVTISGAAEPATGRVLDAVVRWGDGPATLVARDKRLAAPWAALVNGTAAHALDFDDNFDPAKAHASAVLVPSILALAEQEGSSGRDALDAFIAGLQVMGRVGQGVNPVHRNRGWHATATVGTIGAAAACARLLRLDAARAAHAVSISTSMAAGFMSQFGTMTKPVHAGLAARSGILAASLARAGIDAGIHTLDGPHGMNRLMVGPDYEALRDSVGGGEHGQNLRFRTTDVGDPLLILTSGLKVKRFPNCASAHRSMDALIQLMETHGFGAHQISAIHVHAPATHLTNLMHHDPQTGLQSKFSIEHALAILLAGGRASVDDFTDQAVARPELRALYSRIHRHPVDRPESEFPTRLEVELNDGARLSAEVAMPIGSLASPFTIAQLWEKFDGCAAGRLPDAQLADLREILAGLRDLDHVGKLGRLLAAPTLPTSAGTR